MKRVKIEKEADLCSPGKPDNASSVDEAVKYIPTWALVSKARVGLVEGRKSWMV